MRRMTAALLCSLAPIMLAPSAALATGESYCESPDGETMFSYGFGRVPGMAILTAEIRADGRKWQMLSENWSGEPDPEATPMAIAQAASAGGLTIIDFTDPNYEGIIASVRLIATSSDRDFAMAGTLAIEGVGVWPLVCDS